jgi:hypothetical protein
MERGAGNPPPILSGEVMRVIALDRHDKYHEGDQYEVPPHIAEKLIRKGLVKAGPVPQNKMAPPSENKENPMPAVGVDRTSSALPAARVLPMPTVIPLDCGGTTEAQVIAVMGQAPRRRGRPPKAKPDA